MHSQEDIKRSMTRREAICAPAASALSFVLLSRAVCEPGGWLQAAGALPKQAYAATAAPSLDTRPVIALSEFTGGSSRHLASWAAAICRAASRKN